MTTESLKAAFQALLGPVLSTAMDLIGVEYREHPEGKALNVLEIH